MKIENDAYYNLPKLDKWVKEKIKLMYEAKEKYRKEKNDNNYFELKQAIYDLVLELKAVKSEGILNDEEFFEMKDSYWDKIIN